MPKRKKTASPSGNRGIQGQTTKDPTTTTTRQTHESSDKGRVHPPTAEASSSDRAPPVYKARWPTWTCQSVVRLDQAVALSCDVEPAALRNPVEFEFGGFADDDPDETPDADFLLNNERYDIAKSQAGVAFKIVDWVRDERGVKTPRVLMADFAEWAARMGEISSVWRQLPDEFRSLARKERPAPSPAPASAGGEHLAQAESVAAPKPAAEEPPREARSGSAANPTAEGGPAETASPAAPKPIAEETSDNQAPADFRNSVAEGKIALNRDEQSMLVLIRALAAKIGCRLKKTSSDAARIRALAQRIGCSRSLNTVRKFLNWAKTLNPAENLLDGSTAEGAPSDPQERESMLTVILALVTEIERRQQHALTDAAEVGGFVKSVGFSLPDDTITKYLKEARDLKPTKQPHAEADGRLHSAERQTSEPAQGPSAKPS
jgi:hypothetical protein